MFNCGGNGGAIVPPVNEGAPPAEPPLFLFAPLIVWMPFTTDAIDEAIEIPAVILLKAIVGIADVPPVKIACGVANAPAFAVFSRYNFSDC